MIDYVSSRCFDKKKKKLYLIIVIMNRNYHALDIDREKIRSSVFDSYRRREKGVIW